MLFSEFSQLFPQLIHVFFFGGVAIDSVFLFEQIGDVSFFWEGFGAAWKLKIWGSFLGDDHVFIDWDGFSFVGEVVSGQEGILISPEGDPDDILREFWFLIIMFEDAFELKKI